MFAAALSVTFTPAPARAWDDVGHMAVAAVAWRHLTAAARARAVAILRGGPADAGLSQLRPNAGGPDARDFALFARAATWPDLVRDRRDQPRRRAYHRESWHYVNQYWRQGAAGRPEPVDGLPGSRENLVERVTALRRVVADGRARAESRAVALAWVLHLVGDAHQPLHVSARVTAAAPRGDRGGNAVRLGSTDLHAVWDDLLDTSGGRRGGRRRGPGRGEDAKLVRAIGVAERLERGTPMAAVRDRVVEGDPAAWAREGLALAQTVAYAGDVADGGRVPAGYRERARAAAAPHAALAGYRLASLLNAALDSAAR